jgi:hypothetical protein
MKPTIQIETQTLEFYNYRDIQDFLSEKMGIPADKFRGFHKIVGGSYKDFWHTWLDLVDNDVTNGGISTVYLQDMIDELKEGIDEEDEMIGDFYVGDSWERNLIPALEALVQDVGDTIDIRYDW